MSYTIAQLKDLHKTLHTFFIKYGYIINDTGLSIVGHISGIRFEFLIADAVDMSYVYTKVEDRSIIPNIALWHKAKDIKLDELQPIHEWLGWSEEVYADYVKKGLYV